MKKALTRTLTVGALGAATVGALLTVPAEASAVAPNHYGAMAISPSTGNTAYAINYYDVGSARNAAIAKCGAYDCQWVVTMDRNCGAIAQNPVSLQWGYAYGPTRAAAQAAARREAGWGARDIQWACTAR